MPIDPTPTRQKLVDAATRLFAELGVDGVSLAEINRAAGQRNASALQYHFGGREGLLRAVLRPYAATTRTRRRELIAAVTATATAEGRAPTVREAVEVLVRPLGELAAGDWRDRALSRIVADLFTSPHHPWGDLDELLGERALAELAQLLVTTLGAVPAPVRRERLLVATAAAVHATSDWARASGVANRQESSCGPRSIPVELFLENLIDMIAAALSAPVSVPTAAVLAVR